VSEEKPVVEPQTVTEEKPVGRRGSRSLFAPVVLIAAGVLFLLDNLGVVAGLDWATAFRFWPLLLMFLGLNVLVTQIRPPLGSVLSLIVALAAVGVFGYLLLSGSPDAALQRFGLPAPREAQAETFTQKLMGAESAEITLDLSNYPTEITAGAADDLISGAIWTRTSLRLELDHSEDGQRVEVVAGERSGGFSLDPLNWGNEGRAWSFALSPAVPIDLIIDGGNSSVTAELDDLALTGLEIDAGNGGVEATLPEGDYDVRLDGGNGTITLALAGAEEQHVNVEGGNGTIRLVVPEGMPVRVEYDEGNGSVNVDGRFERVSGDDEEGVYETAGYDGGIVMEIDSGNGTVNIVAP
jgi:hypothetical protein